VANSRTRHWHKLSVDAIRGWTTFLIIVVLAGAGVVGYKLLAQHLLKRQSEVAIEEAAELVERLSKEKDLELHRDKYESAQQNLTAAREHFDKGSLAKALLSAERSRTLLTSIVDALRHRNAAGEAQIISRQGGVEVRRGERGEWRTARSRMVVYGGDYIKTSQNGSAEVMMMDGTLFTVRPGTVVLVRRTRTMLGVRSERTLSLQSGWVNLSTSGTGSRVTTPQAEARVEQRSEAVVRYDDTTDEGRFSSFRGELEVASMDGEKQKLGELQQVVQQGEKLSAPRSLPDAPVVVAPDDNKEIRMASTGSLELRWLSVKGAASYSLQVSSNRLFVDNIIQAEERTKTTATLGLKREGNYVWRVAARGRDGELGPWSPAHRFRVVAPVGGASTVGP